MIDSTGGVVVSRVCGQQGRSRRCSIPAPTEGGSMDADLDLLLTAVYVTADDLLPERPGNAKRIVTDAEVVTLCVAQAIMGIPSDRRFLAVASKRLRHLFPSIPGQAGYHKRRRRLTDTWEWLMDVFSSCRRSPGRCPCCFRCRSRPAPARRRLRPSTRLRGDLFDRYFHVLLGPGLHRVDRPGRLRAGYRRAVTVTFTLTFVSGFSPEFST